MENVFPFRNPLWGAGHLLCGYSRLANKLIAKTVGRRLCHLFFDMQYNFRRSLMRYENTLVPTSLQISSSITNDDGPSDGALHR